MFKESKLDRITKDIRKKYQHSQNLLSVKGELVIHGIISHHPLLNQLVQLRIGFLNLREGKSKDFQNLDGSQAQHHILPGAPDLVLQLLEISLAHCRV